MSAGMAWMLEQALLLVDEIHKVEQTADIEMATVGMDVNACRVICARTCCAMRSLPCEF